MGAAGAGMAGRWRTVSRREHRVAGFVASLARVLNVEGYAVLSQDETSRTVRLDLPLLQRQFGIRT